MWFLHRFMSEVGCATAAKALPSMHPGSIIDEEFLKLTVSEIHDLATRFFKTHAYPRCNSYIPA